MATAAIAKAADRAPLLRVEEARAILAECTRVDEVKDIRDKAAAILAYRRQAKASEDAQKDAAEIMLRAERRLGELLAEQREKGERANQGTHRKKSHPATSSPPPTLKDLGIGKDAAARWQEVAKVPEKKFEKYVQAQRRLDGGEITRTGLIREARRRDVTAAMNVSDEEEGDRRFTRRALIEKLHAEFQFTVDATSEKSAPSAGVIGRYWTKKDDVFRQKLKFERPFFNPPFSRLLAITELISRAVGRGDCPVAVMVGPATRTEQPWWQRHIEPIRDGRHKPGEMSIETRFLDGREKYGSPEDPGAQQAGSPPFTTVLVIFRSGARQ